MSRAAPFLLKSWRACSWAARRRLAMDKTRGLKARRFASFSCSTEFSICLDFAKGTKVSSFKALITSHHQYYADTSKIKYWNLSDWPHRSPAVAHLSPLLVASDGARLRTRFSLRRINSVPAMIFDH